MLPLPLRLSPHVIISSTPPSPQPTLFPYTTLFRSPAPQHRGAPQVTHREAHRAAAAGRRLTCCLTSDQSADRKSTRLNSSHVAISYAVFCLKKKDIDIILHVCDRVTCWTR